MYTGVQSKKNGKVKVLLKNIVGKWLVYPEVMYIGQDMDLGEQIAPIWQGGREVQGLAARKWEVVSPENGENMGR